MFARTFVESGANSIVILDLDAAQAKQSAKDIITWFEEHGQAEKGEIKAMGLGCDVSSEEQVKSCFAKIIKKFGRVDVLVTAAGIVGKFCIIYVGLTVSTDLLQLFAENFSGVDYPADKFRKLMAVNVDGTFFCAREAAKDMMKREAPGSIIM